MDTNKLVYEEPGVEVIKFTSYNVICEGTGGDNPPPPGGNEGFEEGDI